MLKRFYLIFAVFCVSLVLIFSCSTGELDPFDPDYDPDDETELDDPDKKDKEDEDEKDEEDIPDPAAEFLSVNFVSETEIVFEFSLPVKLESLSFNPGMEFIFAEEENIIIVTLDEELKPGQRFWADIEVIDDWENIITEKLSLISLNKRPPDLLINELRTEWASATTRTEFIEFRILSAGNMGGLRVFAASNTREPMIYEFKPVEVNEGEYVVLHLRTLEASCISEYGDDLNESGGRDSSPAARDIWIAGSNKLLRKTDAVYVLDQDDRVFDAVMLSENSDAEWARSHFQEAAEFLFRQGAWKSPTGGIAAPADAVSSSAIGTAITRSISRDEALENSGTAADWYVTGNNGATPGLPNQR